MEIDLQTKIAGLLDAYPALEKTLLELSPAFAKLQNPMLRRTVARVTTLQQAARIAGISPALMIQALRQAAGLAASDNAVEADDNQESIPPVWFDVAKISIRFDATPVIDSGQSPMQEIIRLAGLLKSDEIMELTSPFEPVPIIDLLKAKSFEVWSDQNKTYITPR